jgi:hypothetical protein
MADTMVTLACSFRAWRQMVTEGLVGDDVLSLCADLLRSLGKGGMAAAPLLERTFATLEPNFIEPDETTCESVQGMRVGSSVGSIGLRPIYQPGYVLKHLAGMQSVYLIRAASVAWRQVWRADQCGCRVWRPSDRCQVSNADDGEWTHATAGSAGEGGSRPPEGQAGHTLTRCAGEVEDERVLSALTPGGPWLSAQVLEASIEPAAADTAVVAFELWQEVRRQSGLHHAPAPPEPFEAAMQVGSAGRGGGCRARSQWACRWQNGLPFASSRARL